MSRGDGRSGLAAVRGAALPPGVSIRAATAADEAAMVALEHESAIHHATIDPSRWRVLGPAAVAASRRRRAAASPFDEALVAEADGRVVGMIELWLRRPRDPNNARDLGVFVDLGVSVGEAWRGRGIGTALLLAAEDWARAHGADRMMLDLDAANHGAQRLYERLGYEVHGLFMDKVLGGPGPAAATRSDGERFETLVPELDGVLVHLRPIRPDDRAALVAVLSDPSVVAVWDTRGPESSADELVAGEDGWHVWAIEVDGRFAGSIQASEEDDDPDYRHAGIDIFLSSDFQGHGYGTDAVRTVAGWLLDVRGHHRLTIDPAASNERAIRTYEKVGFKPVGVMRRYERGSDGTFHDGLLMDLLAGELR